MSEFISQLFRPLFFALLFFACQQQVNDLQGKVIAITDGDTIKILKNNQQVKIRLYGIDSPERKQAYGTRAKEFASSLAFGKYVQIISHGKDRYGRVLGEVILPDGRNMNEEMIRYGYAWHYSQYSNNPAFELLELEARSEKRGLWQDPNPVPPWEFRKKKRSKKNKRSPVY